MINLEKTIISDLKPLSKNVLWVDVRTSVAKAFINGEWKPLSEAADSTVKDVLLVTSEGTSSVVEDGVAKIDVTEVVITIDNNNFEYAL